VTSGAARVATMAALAGAVASGCAGGPDRRTAPLFEVGFGAGARAPADDDDDPLVSASLGAGVARWWSRGEGPARQHLGLGVALSLTWFDLERGDVGLDLLMAPPRGDRRNGFQFRLGPRVSTDGEHAGAAFAAEWSDAFVGALFAEAGYDFRGEEAEFLFGARVNLLFPVTFVTATPFAME
jgi:hypothetical protein